jgi:hypothetical protein
MHVGMDRQTPLLISSKQDTSPFSDPTNSTKINENPNLLNNEKKKKVDFKSVNLLFLKKEEL